MNNYIYSADLTPPSIDAMSEKVSELLKEMNLPSKEIMRYRLTVEEVMGIWGEELRTDTRCHLIMKEQFGKTALLLQTEGKSVDPTKYHDSLMLSVTRNPNIATALGMPAEYVYTGGCNELRLRLPKKHPNSSVQVLISMVAGVVLGLALRLLAPAFSVSLSNQVISPVLYTIANLLRLIAGPLIFLSIVAGITGVGDAASFGKMGRLMVTRFLVITLVLTAVVWLALIWLNPIVFSTDASGQSGFGSILQMILNIVPSDFVTPFQTGNALQIIFIAGGIGIGMLLLGDTVTEVKSVVNQSNSVVQLIMSGFSRILPGFIFLSILKLTITSDLRSLSQIVVPLVIIFVLAILFIVLYGLYASVVSGMPVATLLKKQFPTFLMGFTTASSAAAFGTNVECCEKELGIDERMTQFGVPIGQILFKPGGCVLLVVIALYMAYFYGVEVTPSWIFKMIVVVTIVTVATPPIPGGPLTSIMVIYTQLRLPAESVAIAATIITFADYVVTACNITCLQQELLICAKKLGLLKKQET